MNAVDTRWHNQTHHADDRSRAARLLAACGRTPRRFAAPGCTCLVAVTGHLGGLVLARVYGTTADFGSGACRRQAESSATALHTEAAPFFAEHCVVCHGNRLSTVNLNLEALAARLDSRARSAGAGASGPDGNGGDRQTETWARVLGKLTAGQMPPPGRPRPADDALARVTASIEAYLADTGYRRTPDPGRVTARRLNRVEYDNTVRSLLGVHGSPADEFPIDDSGYGFDNIGDVLSVSPLLMEKYVAAAKRLSRLAVFGEPLPAEPTLLARYMGRRSHDAGNDLSGTDVLPFSMRGALYGTHLFPWDADYEFRFRAANYRYSRRQLVARGVIEPDERDTPDAVAAAAEAALTEEERRARFIENARRSQPPVPVVATLDGEVFREELIEGSRDFGYERGEFVTRVPVTAGVHEFRISYPHVADIADPRDNVNPDGRRILYVDYVDIVGPFEPSPAPPASYERLFICRHRPGGHDEACAEGNRHPAGAAGVPASGDRRRHRPARRARAAGASRGRFLRRGNPARRPGGAALPQLPLPDRAGSDRRRSNPGARRPRAGVAALLLPVGRHAGRAALPARRRGPAHGPRRAAGRSAAHAGRSEGADARHRLRRAVAATPRPRPRQAGPRPVSDRRRRAARRHADRDRSCSSTR